MRTRSLLALTVVTMLTSLWVASCGDDEGTDVGAASCDPGFFGLDCEPCPTGSSCDGTTFTPTQCPTGTWDDDGDSSTECAPWTICVAGEQVAAPGTTTSDQSCRPCGDGTFSSATNAAECEAWSDCAAGSYVDEAGTESSDRTCTGCATGTFSSDANADACEEWSDCEPGTFVDVRGSETRDRVCEACPNGETTDSANASSCTPIGACPAGTSGEDCVPCDVGEYCAGDDAPALGCASGTWDHDEDPATACEPWTNCVAGEEIDADGTTTTDRTCVDCGSGAFTTEPNQESCAAWSDCEAGTRVSSGGSTTANRACSPCESGTFSDVANAAECAAWSDCAVGQQVAGSGSASSDRTCEACPDRTYSVAINTPACRAWTECPSGTAEGSGGSTLADVNCVACAEGTYCAGGDAAAAPCAEGTWDHDANPATACESWTVCGPGTAEGSGGTATTDRTCASCTEGTFADGSGAESCSDWSTCIAGQRVTTAPTSRRDRGCETCPAGSYSNTTNASSCTAWSDCEPGEFIDGSGSSTDDRACDDCPEDTYSSSPNSESCTDFGTCAAGTILDTAGTSTSAPICEACSAGTYCAGGEADEVACAEGTWDHDANPASECEAKRTCEAGDYVFSEGGTTTDRTCVECTAGFFSTTENAGECVRWTSCEAGTFIAEAGSSTSDRVCSPCESGYTGSENAVECTPWTLVCEGPVLAAPSSTRDRVCADTTPCDELDTEETCVRSLETCTWLGSSCADRTCDSISDPDECSRFPGCEYDYAGSTNDCSTDPTPALECEDILNGERCIQSGLGCAYDDGSGACTDAGAPRDCALGDFGPWSACSLPCEGGVRFREQEVVEEAVGGFCDPEQQSEPCNVGITCSCDVLTDQPSCELEDGCAWDTETSTCGEPVDCVVSEWGEWSACSLPCEGGTRTRTRSAEIEPAFGGAACPATEETESCLVGVPCVCSELTSQSQCDMVEDCGWRNGAVCVDTSPQRCDEIANQTDCVESDFDCTWLAALGKCLTAP